ncbi:HD domain-containing protein [Klebsiella pasteurii]|uniref:HD domain-containing protein n=1 Tax=Klebsiella pasteurii TaxID=2587529 RepID=A0ABD5HHI6_9ENTR|nr:HD domain-containing protein [Klebsiella pasteurii]MBG2720155.1 HD domain-containing protein [Klebsiella michiganensis]MDW2716888.1 HD domain-containing protein [Klebsiella pasteurii]
MVASVRIQSLIEIHLINFNYADIMTIHLLPTLGSIANIIDMINPRLNLHHVRTAFIASHLAKLVDFSAAQRRKTILAALIHDVGGLNEKSRLEPLNYIDNEDNHHALIGSELLSRIPLFRPLNKIVRYHHTHWRNGLGHYSEGEQVPEESHLLFFADRLDVLYCQHRTEHIPLLSKRLVDIAAAGAPILYKQEYIQAFRILSADDYFWSVMASTNYRDYIKAISGVHNDTLSLHNLRDIAELVSFIIDQFSQQTPWHSAAVGHIAGYLATKMEMSAMQALKVEIGGLLHNISCLDHSPPPKRVGSSDKAQRYFYLIEGIDDISEWLAMQNDPASAQRHNKALQPEAMLIAVSRRVVHALNGPKAEEKSLAQLIKNNPGEEIPPLMLSLIAQYSSQIIQIYRATAGEIKKLVNRIAQLTHSV